jgi:hypothetical protein
MEGERLDERPPEAQLKAIRLDRLVILSFAATTAYNPYSLTSRTLELSRELAGAPQTSANFIFCLLAQSPM